MNQILYEEALSLLRNYRPAVHMELYRAYRRAVSPNTRYYLADGCLVVESVGENQRYYYIHEVAEDNDFSTVTRKVYEYFEAERACHETFHGEITLCRVGALSERADAFYGFRQFVRHGNDEQYEPDPHVMPLTREDFPDIDRLCASSNTAGDTMYGHLLAQMFTDVSVWAEEEDRFVGYRSDEGELLGVAEWQSVDELNLGFLRMLYVSQKHRRHGVGQALVRAAMSNLPDRVWLYQAARDNIPSMALAKSLGFTFDGANLLVHSVP